MTTLINVLIIAFVANIVMDVYEFLLERLLGKTRDWHLVGRWVANIPKGSFILDTNDETLAIPGELALGWIFHYVVGIAYVGVYLFGVEYILGEPPSVVSAIGFGVITVVAPWFILMPGLGVGMFAINAGRANFVRAASLSVHAVFGIGIFLGIVVAGMV